MALEKVQEILPTLVIEEVKDVRDEKQVLKVVKSSIMSKQLGLEDFIAGIVTKACGNFIIVFYRFFCSLSLKM
jgi:T-complex protein 1 subunit theta